MAVRLTHILQQFEPHAKTSRPQRVGAQNGRHAGRKGRSRVAEAQNHFPSLSLYISHVFCFVFLCSKLKIYFKKNMLWLWNRCGLINTAVSQEPVPDPPGIKSIATRGEGQRFFFCFVFCCFFGFPPSASWIVCRIGSKKLDSLLFACLFVLTQWAVGRSSRTFQRSLVLVAGWSDQAGVLRDKPNGREAQGEEGESLATDESPSGLAAVAPAAKLGGSLTVQPDSLALSLQHHSCRIRALYFPAPKTYISR